MLTIVRLAAVASVLLSIEAECQTTQNRQPDQLDMPVMGAYYQSKLFHKIDGPCIEWISGFRVMFDTARMALDAGYAPCSYCAAAYQPTFERKLHAIQQRWNLYVKSARAGETMAAQRDANAAYADGEGTGHAAAAAVWGKESNTSYTAAGMALLSGNIKGARRLAARAEAEEAMAGIEEANAAAWFGEMARQEYLANFNRQYALKAKEDYLRAVDLAALTEMGVEWQALTRSVDLHSRQGRHFDAAMVAGFAWMMALASDDPARTAAAAEAMAKATTAYVERAEPDSEKWIDNTLTNAWELGAHGFPAYGLLSSNLIRMKYPDNKTALRVYTEVSARYPVQ
ncbi:MAG: hypothetical protein ABFE08_07760 [Armatimonadia bacterium]